MFCKEKRLRKFHNRRRHIHRKMNDFEIVGKITFIGTTDDLDGNLVRYGWGFSDPVVIGFLVGEEVYRGIIHAMDLFRCGFNPKYGQTYRFHSVYRREIRNNYTLVFLSDITSVE